MNVVAFELLPRKQRADLVAASSRSRALRTDGLTDEIDQPSPEVLLPALYAGGEHGRDALTPCTLFRLGSGLGGLGSVADRRGRPKLDELRE